MTLDLSNFNYLKELDPKEYRRELAKLIEAHGDSLPKELSESSFYHDKTPVPPRPTIDELFKRYLPDSMYYDHYRLTELYGYGYTPQDWRTYLRDNALFIETELAAIAEAEARSALSRLGNASGQEVTALKAILEKSKLINDSQKQQTKVLMTFIPPSKPQKEDSHENNRGNDPSGMQSPSRYSSSEK